MLVYGKKELPTLLPLYNITNSADIGSTGVAMTSNSDVSGIRSSSRPQPSSNLLKQGTQGSALQGDFVSMTSFFL